MAFGTRHCCCLALLLVITQVMLSTAYTRDSYTTGPRDDDYGDSRGHGYHNSDRNSHDRTDTRQKHSDVHHKDDGHDHDDSAATSVQAMFHTTMLVGTSLVLYWI